MFVFVLHFQIDRKHTIYKLFRCMFALNYMKVARIKQVRMRKEQTEVSYFNRVLEV